MRYWRHNIDSILIRQNEDGTFDYMNLLQRDKRWILWGSISGKKLIRDIKYINTSKIPFIELSELEVNKLLMIHELAR